MQENIFASDLKCLKEFKTITKNLVYSAASNTYIQNLNEAVTTWLSSAACITHPELH